MYKRIGYIYIILSVAAHIALLLGLAVYPANHSRTAWNPRPDNEEKFKVRLYETPEEKQMLTAKKEEPKKEEKKEVFLPEKKFLDFSDIPAGKEPEKALVYGQASTEASNDFYKKRAKKPQYSETIAALPRAKVGRLLMREPAPALDARTTPQVSRPAKLQPLYRKEESRGGKEQSRELEPKLRVREPRPPLEGPLKADVQHPLKRELLRKENIYARYQPAPGEKGRVKEPRITREEPRDEMRGKVREPRMIDRLAPGREAGPGKKILMDFMRKPEVSASRRLGTELNPAEMMKKELSAREEQIPDIPTDKLSKHASIKNSDEDASNGSDVKVVSLDTQELKYVSYFWHVKQKITNLWAYPIEAQRMGMEGVVVIRMNLLRTGELEKVQLVRSSGYGILDSEARDAVVMAGPFHPFPEQIKDRKLIIEGYFRYMGNYWSP